MEEETASRREDFAITAVSGSRKIVAVRCVSDPCERTRVRVCVCVCSLLREGSQRMRSLRSMCVPSLGSVCMGVSLLSVELLGEVIPWPYRPVNCNIGVCVWCEIDSPWCIYGGEWCCYTSI